MTLHLASLNPKNTFQYWVEQEEYWSHWVPIPHRAFVTKGFYPRRPRSNFEPVISSPSMAQHSASIAPKIRLYSRGMWSPPLNQRWSVPSIAHQNVSNLITVFPNACTNNRASVCYLSLRVQISNLAVEILAFAFAESMMCLRACQNGSAWLRANVTGTATTGRD